MHAKAHKFAPGGLGQPALQLLSDQTGNGRYSFRSKSCKLVQWGLDPQRVRTGPAAGTATCDLNGNVVLQMLTGRNRASRAGDLLGSEALTRLPLPFGGA